MLLNRNPVFLKLVNPWSLASLLSVVLFSLPTSNAIAQPFDEAPSTLKVMTWNVEWMFDAETSDNRSKLAKEQSAPDRNYWNEKLNGVAKVIADARPHIVALQEIEGRQTLSDIVKVLKSNHRTSYRYAFIQGTDTFTEQDVGFLVKSGLVSYGRNEQSKTMYDSREFYNLSKHIVAEFRWRNVESPLRIINVHFRATADAEDKRVKQAKLARRWLESSLSMGEDAILLGDFNSEYPAGTIKGDIAAIVGSGSGPRMVDLLAQQQPSNQQTHLILDKQFDRIMASESLVTNGRGKDWVFTGIDTLSEAVVRGRRDSQEHWDQRLTMDPTELDLSDHFPVVATFRLQ